MAPTSRTLLKPFFCAPKVTGGDKTAAILTDTGTTLDAALAVVDGNVDAIKAKTDSLTFTVAGNVDANTLRINDVEITGDGSGTPFDV
jgi:hypothetical protein